MRGVAAARPIVEHGAVRVLPLPVNATAEQPVIEMPPSVKLTLPVGARPVTDAVNVTLAPESDGFAELATVVAVAVLTTCDSVALVETALVASPLYVATMLRVPAASALVEHAAVRVLPLPVSATAEHPAIDTPPFVKLTVPVGASPVTDAVNVTLAPATEGFAELASVVVVAVAPPELTVCDTAALVDVR